MDESSLLLSSGYRMPLVGLGTSRQEAGAMSVKAALAGGYRLIDTAFAYQNEEEVGQLLQEWVKEGGGVREEVFVVTKLPAIAMRAEDVETFCKKSLVNLNLEYIDLYLIHVPYGRQKVGDIIFPTDDKNKPLFDFATDIIAVWKEMEKLVEKGLVRSIGVSNYSISQLRKTIAVSRIPPAVIQSELHVRHQQKEMVEFCKDHNIAMMSYATLGSPGRKGHAIGEPKFIDLLGDPVVQLVANNHHASTAQILLKFWVQQGIVVIPKSSNAERLASNIKLFGWSLSDTEMDALATLDLKEHGKLFIYDKSSGIFDHPEFTGQ